MLRITDAVINLTLHTQTTLARFELDHSERLQVSLTKCFHYNQNNCLLCSRLGSGKCASCVRMCSGHFVRRGENTINLMASGLGTPETKLEFDLFDFFRHESPQSLLQIGFERSRTFDCTRWPVNSHWLANFHRFSPLSISWRLKMFASCKGQLHSLNLIRCSLFCLLSH